MLTTSTTGKKKISEEATLFKIVKINRLRDDFQQNEGQKTMEDF